MLIALTLLTLSATEASLSAAIDACNSKTGPCKIQLPEGEVVLTRTMKLCAPVSLEGAGADLTTLRTATSTTAIHVLPAIKCKELGKNPRGSTSISRMTILGKRPLEADLRVSVGVLAESKFRMSETSIKQFVIGIRITADVNRKLATNANGWRMHDVFIQGNEHAGFIAHGGDSNVGLWSGGYSGSNCQRASKWDSIISLPCAGVIERSFLGSSFVAISTASNRSKKPGCYTDTANCLETTYPGFDFSGLNQRSVCIGCYTESDQAVSKISRNSIAFGGLSSWEGPGLRLVGTYASGLTLSNSRDIANVTELTLGGAQNVGGTFLTLQPPRGNRAAVPGVLRLKWDPTSGEYLFDVSNLGASKSFRIVGESGGVKPVGSIRVKSTHMSVE